MTQGEGAVGIRFCFVCFGGMALGLLDVRLSGLLESLTGDKLGDLLIGILLTVLLRLLASLLGRSQVLSKLLEHLERLGAELAENTGQKLEELLLLAVTRDNEGLALAVLAADSDVRLHYCQS